MYYYLINVVCEDGNLLKYILVNVKVLFMKYNF
jgi:hypothetical protein